MLPKSAEYLTKKIHSKSTKPVHNQQQRHQISELHERWNPYDDFTGNTPKSCLSYSAQTPWTLHSPLQIELPLLFKICALSTGLPITPFLKLPIIIRT